jgi:hypothetical protein
VKQSTATRRPDFRNTFKQYEGHDLKLANMEVIWSVGKTPRQAIFSLGRARKWGKITGLKAMPSPDYDAYAWGYRFWADGTSMKAAGICVPGGVICTWWK